MHIFLLLLFFFFSSLEADSGNYISDETYMTALEEVYHLYKDDDSGKLLDYTDDVPPVDPSQFGMALLHK